MTVRIRILAWTLLVVAIALSAMVLLTGQALLARIEANAAGELEHEAEKLRVFAVGAGETNGAVYTDVQQVLVDYLAHNVPEQDETYFSIVDGSADRRSTGDPPVRLDADDAFVEELATLRAPASGRLDTTAGPAVYAALPVRVDQDPSEGILVVVEFLGPAQDEAWSTILTMAVSGLFALAVAGAAGWFVAGRALAPIREVQETAARIGGMDLGRRIDVIGTDDVAQLAVTFNGMLDRVQSAFDGQQRFLDDAGHELRTPITVVRGHLELMGDDPEEREQTLRLVDDELRRMSRLVDDLILLARSERPDFLVPGPVNLADLVVESLAKATAIAKRAWTIDAVPEGTVIADGERLTQALLQLAANAAAHTEDGEIIAVGGATDETRLRLWIRDEGRGIPEEEQNRIFQRFVRGRAARSRQGGGLGLAIVASIAEAHGGEAGVESTPGHGAVFTLSIPYRPKQETT